MPRNECKPLLDACGPDIYSRNAFRLLGMHVDQPGRRIKKQEKDLQAELEIGDLADEYCETLRPNPLPTREELSQAGRQLSDPQQRFISEFFWFWPLEWGKSASDEALGLLNAGKAIEARKRWTQIVTEDGEASAVARHNLAVLGHWLVLDREQKILLSADTDKSAREQRQEIIGYWNFAFKHWEALCEDESFWSMLADRIRGLNDPRLTTGFLRRFSQSLPIAFDNINADLAVAYCERGMYASAKDHVEIMKATNAGNDDVDASLRRVTEPLQRRIDQAIETAMYQLSHNKAEGKQRSVELFETVLDMLNVLQALLGKESPEYAETCDRIAATVRGCMIDYGNETKNWSQCIVVLKQAASLAFDDRLRSRIEEDIAIAEENKKGEKDEEATDLVNRALEEIKAGWSAEGRRTLREALATCHDPDLRQNISSLIQEMDVPVASAPRRRNTGDSGEYRNIGRTAAPRSTARATEQYSTEDAVGAFTYVIAVAVLIFGCVAIPWLAGSCDNKASQSHSLSDSPSPEPRTHTPPQRPASTDRATDSPVLIPPIYIPPIYTPPRKYVPTRTDNGLSKKIDSGKARLQTLADEIGRMDSEIESLSVSIGRYKRELEGYNSQLNRGVQVNDDLYQRAMNGHNHLAGQYNSLVSQRKLKYEDYKRELDSVNDMVGRYNLGER